MLRYVPLRVYSVFSQGKGAVSAGVLADFLKERDILFLPVSDPFSVVGWESFRQEAVARQMRPLLGMEVRIRQLGALVMYPLSKRGYFSLVRSLNQRTFTGVEEVAVICVLHGAVTGGSAALERIRQQVGAENFYLGLEWNSGRWVVDLARELSIPLVWAQPWRWVVNPEQYAVVAAVFQHHTVGEVMTGMRGQELPLFGPLGASAITKRFGEAGKNAMMNTFTLAGRVRFDFSAIAPDPDPVGGGEGSNPQQVSRLAALVYSVAPSYARNGDPNTILEEVINRETRRMELSQAERERTFRELDIIKKMGFSPYFLIAAEIASYCRKHRIYFNLRGSGVSSFVLYLLGLSRVNPLHHDLLFERFINSLREDLPDIDIDIDSSRRGQVLTWVFETYRNRVVFVSTHKFFKARSALYEVARCSGVDVESAHGMTRDLPLFAAPAELRAMAAERGPMADIYRQAALLDGVYKELSLHLGGVLFCDGESRQLFPVEQSPHGFDQVVWDKNTIERLNLFKLDLLGVRGFDVIAPAVLDGDVDTTDPEVWENIQKARTIGCFQLESPLSRKHLAMVRPRNLQEVAISIAIIRPGPAKSGMKEAYIEKREPIHPALAKIFPYTRGTVIFEEQISVLLHSVTGWNLELAEKIRRCLKRKRGGEYREDFFRRGRVNGWQREDLETFWKLAEDFAQYAFNQGHSVSYAYSAYASAWFKTRHPLVFFVRLLNAGGGYYPLPQYVEEAKNWGLTFLPPDINRSAIGFCAEGGAIRTGLIFVKGVGYKLAGRIVEARGAGYATLEDFIGRTRIGEKDLAVLMAVSALSSLGHNGFTRAEREAKWKNYLGFIPEAAQRTNGPEPD